MVNKNPPMTPQQEEYLVFIWATNSNLSVAKATKLVNEVFIDTPLTERQVGYIKPKLAERIKGADTTSLLRIATENGALSLHKKVARISLLEQIALDCARGYDYELGDAAGGTNIIKKKEYRTAIDAIKQIREEIGTETPTDNTTYNVIVQELKVNNKEEPLPGDEDL